MKATKIFRYWLVIQFIAVILKLVADFQVLTEFQKLWVLILFYLKEIVFLMIILPFILLYLMSWVGMFFYLRPARVLYNITFISETMIYPFMVSEISDNCLADLLAAISAMAGGIVIAMANFSDIKTCFEKAKEIETVSKSD